MILLLKMENYVFKIENLKWRPRHLVLYIELQ